MINPHDLRKYVITPTLAYLNLGAEASAELLLLGTFYTESTVAGQTRLHQLGTGPALGGYQIEPRTHADLWANFLERRPQTRALVQGLLAPTPAAEQQLIGNLNYATAVARLLYYRHTEPLPQPDDYQGLANYWKRYYNTQYGAGVPAKFVATLDNLA